MALCKLLLEAPDMLLLDEPTNHLDAETIAWLQRHLIDYKGTCLIVTHDRYFLDDITGWILELDRGRGIPYEGNYSAWLEQKAKRLAQEDREDKARQKTLEKELDWIRAGVKARQAKQKARINAYNELAEQSEREKVGRAQIIIPNGPRLGQRVIEVEDLKKGFGDNLLIDGLSFALPPGGIVGVIGPNGAGKSTLFRMLTGQEKPDAGEVHFGDTVKLAYVDQSRDHLDDKKTVWEEISDGQDIIKLGDAEVNSRAYCSAFNFKGGDQQKTMNLLSGGERNRVHMAKLLREGGNVLLLDEPTNDLDVETLRALKTRLKTSRAARSSSATTASSSTGSAPISSPSRATRMWSGSRGISRPTKRTRSAALARIRSSRSGSNTRNSPADLLRRAPRLPGHPTGTALYTSRTSSVHPAYSSRMYNLAGKNG